MNKLSKTNEIRQLAEIYVMVSKGQMTQLNFFLAFRTRFEADVRIEKHPLLSQLLK